jgi:hypothetical protein
MKKILFLSLLICLASVADAQIFKSPYKKALEKQTLIAEAQLDTFDFVIPPIERIPERVQGLSAASATNWGVQLLLPADVVKLMQDSCKYAGILKITDTGSKQTHVDLQAGQLAGANYTTDAGLTDGNGHGTHVAGICVGSSIGLLWPLVQNGLVQWKPVQVLSAGGAGNFSWCAQAYTAEYASDLAAINAGKFVVYNGSFGGGTGKVTEVENALKKSYAAGVAFVFAAGNTGQPGVQYPGNSPYGFGTASLNSNLSISSYSSRGPEVLAGMPGAAINSTWKDNTYAVLSGTSMASPFMASAVFIARSRWGSQLSNVDKLRAYMIWVASDLPPVGKDNDTGYGIEYIRSILTKSPKGMGPVTPPPPPPPPIDPPKDTVPVVPLRTLTFDLPDDYNIVWGTTSAAGKAKTAQFSKTKAQAAAYKPMKITTLTVAFKSTAPASYSEKILKDAVSWFFNNRGFQLLPGMDENDALYYSAYFLKMLAKSERKVDLSVVRIGTESGLYLDNPK